MMSVKLSCARSGSSGPNPKTSSTSSSTTRSAKNVGTCTGRRSRIRRTATAEALASLDAEFEALYTDFGRPSIPPERLIRASLIQILFSVRSERQLMEQMQYNLLFRWFVGLGIDDPVWVPTVFTKNRDRLLTTEMSRKVMAAILAHREVAPLLSDDHFSVDGTLVKAWASMKSFQPKARRHAAR
jgi:transposase